MPNVKDSISLITGTIMLFLIGVKFGVPLDEFYFTSKIIIDATDDMPKAPGEWGKIQEETTNSVKFSHHLLEVVASIIGILSLILAGWFLITKYEPSR